jgi:two-component system LytT family sensor kinase
VKSVVRIDWRIPVGVAAALILLFTLQNYGAPVVVRGGQSIGRTFGIQVIVWTTWLLLCPLIFAAARRWRSQGRITAGNLVSQLMIAFAVAVLHSIIASAARWVLGWPVSDDLAVVILNTIATNLASNLLRYSLISSAYHAVAYHQEVRDRDVRAARLEGSLVQAKLDSLQGRLHPHFLFNTLNSISALIREQPAAAEQMLGSLSELLRASLDAEPSREVTLERELDLARQYTSIQQTRFADRLSVSFEAGPDVQDALVPHLILQPLVENAIRHGIAPRDAAGHVRIAAGREGGRLHLIVEDDGVGVAADRKPAPGSGFGLSSTRARLEHLYGQAATLAVTPRVPTGTVVTVDLPFRAQASALPGTLA